MTMDWVHPMAVEQAVEDLGAMLTAQTTKWAAVLMTKVMGIVVLNF
jgi:hypothetical protein